MSKLIKKVFLHILDILIYLFDLLEHKKVSKITDDHLEENVEMGKPISDDSKFDSAVRKFNLWWGILFRILFICSLGLFTRLMVDAPSIGDIPLSELTLNSIFKNLAEFLVPIFCIFWLFNVPVKSSSIDKESNPYEGWSAFGYLLILIAVAYLFYLYGWDYIIHR